MAPSNDSGETLRIAATLDAVERLRPPEATAAFVQAAPLGRVSEVLRRMIERQFKARPGGWAYDPSPWSILTFLHRAQTGNVAESAARAAATDALLELTWRHAHYAVFQEKPGDAATVYELARQRVTAEYERQSADILEIVA